MKRDAESMFCPLLSLKPGPEANYCETEKCAWAYGGHCAIVTIAQCLDGLNEHGIIVWPEDEQ